MTNKKDVYMKKTYTKKQITEAIAHWKKILTEEYDFGQKTVKTILPDELD